MPKNIERYESVFAEALTKHLEQTGMSIINLSDKTGMSYEHARKLLRGKTMPSPLMLKAICEAMGLDHDEMNRLVTADRIRMRFGTVPLEISGKKPQLAGLERVVDELSPRQISELEGMAKTMARNNRNDGRR